VKRCYAAVILVIMLFNGAGFYIYYALHLRQIRMEMREALKYLPENELEIIKLSHEQFFEAKVEEHEVKVGGKMYDIARVLTMNDSLYVYCLHDEKEDNLIAFLDHVSSVPCNQNSSIPAALAKLIVISYDVPANNFDVEVEISPSRPFTPYQFNHKNFCKSLISPPPWHLS
jgi:hypothetical protein